MHLSLTLFFASIALALAGKESTDTPQWLETPRTPATAAWLTHRIVDAQISGKPAVGQSLTALLRAEKLTVPCAQDGVFFFTKRGPGEKAASIYVRTGPEGKDELLIDAAKIDGAKNAVLTIAAVSADSSLLVYGAGESNDGERSVHVFDRKAGRDLPDVLPRARYHTVSVGPAGKGVYYAKVEPAGTRIFFHAFGTEIAADKYVFGEMYNYEPLGPKDSIATEVAESGHYLFLSVRRGQQAKRVDVYAQELDEPDQKMRPIIHAMDSHFSFVNHGGELFVLTDNEAPKGRVVRIVIDDPHPLRWETLVPESADEISGISIVGNTLFVSAAHGGATRTRIFTLKGKETGQLVTPKTDFAQRAFHVCKHD